MTNLGPLKGMLPSELVTSLEIEASKRTRLTHLQPITPTDAQLAPGLGPVPVVMGAVPGLAFTTIATDKAYRIFKIPLNMSPDVHPTLHVHWTKNGNVDESGKTVRWQVSRTLFNGRSEDISVATPTLVWDDTYEDSGTTSRIVYRTADSPAIPGCVPGDYAGIMIEVTGAGTTMATAPVLISVDMYYYEIME